MQNLELEKALENLERDGSWLSKNYGEISEKYLNEFIAIKDCTIIAHNPDFDVFLKELNSINVDLNEVLVEYIPGKDFEVIM